ncbi:hypothetical protein ACUY2E_07455 [Corynebacterium confusum]
MTTGEDTHDCDYFTSLFLLPQLCNSTNLTLLCEFHNSWNDDDPAYPRHGRVNRRHGKVTWDPPWNSG